MKIIRVVPVIVAVALAACGSDKSNQAATDGAASQADTSMDPSSGMQGMGGMQGMDSMGGMKGMDSMGGMMGDDMSKNMEAHMQQMMGAGTDSMQAMLPMHRQMTANMLSQMNKQMRDMKMTDNTEWPATVDSVRQDLVRMPDMSGQELRTFMSAHHERLRRLMAMHRDMMKKMKM